MCREHDVMEHERPNLFLDHRKIHELSFFELCEVLLTRGRQSRADHSGQGHDNPHSKIARELALSVTALEEAQMRHNRAHALIKGIKPLDAERASVY